MRSKCFHAFPDQLSSPDFSDRLLIKGFVKRVRRTATRSIPKSIPPCIRMAGSGQKPLMFSQFSFSRKVVVFKIS